MRQAEGCGDYFGDCGGQGWLNQTTVIPAERSESRDPGTEMEAVDKRPLDPGSPPAAGMMLWTAPYRRRAGAVE